MRPDPSLPHQDPETDPLAPAAVPGPEREGLRYVFAISGSSSRYDPRSGPLCITILSHRDQLFQCYPTGLDELHLDDEAVVVRLLIQLLVQADLFWGLAEWGRHDTPASLFRGFDAQDKG